MAAAKFFASMLQESHFCLLKICCLKSATTLSNFLSKSIEESVNDTKEKNGIQKIRNSFFMIFLLSLINNKYFCCVRDCSGKPTAALEARGARTCNGKPDPHSTVGGTPKYKNSLSSISNNTTTFDIQKSIPKTHNASNTRISSTSTSSVNFPTPLFEINL